MAIVTTNFPPGSSEDALAAAQTVTMSRSPAFVADTLEALQNGRPPIAGIQDNLASLRIVDAAYRSSAQGEAVQLS